MSDLSYGGYSPDERVPHKHTLENLWLVKPHHLNQGRGIEIFKQQKDIFNFIMSKRQSAKWVIQKYIEKPLLYMDRKFDIRVWVLKTPSEILFYREGYLRTSATEFTTNIRDNTNVHLTNNCFQKHLENYGEHEPGNTLSFQAFREYMAGIDEKFDLDAHIVPRMKDIVIDSMLCTDMNPS